MIIQRPVFSIFWTILILTGIGSQLKAQEQKKYIYTGNESYKKQKFKEAESAYRKSIEKSGTTLEGNFNLGDALFKQKKFAEAGDRFTKIANTETNPSIKADAYHNLGNSLLVSKKLEESVEAYKKSLIQNPKDNQTRYNLAYAQELLKKQQEQNQKNKDQNKKNDKNEKDNKKDGKSSKDPTKDPKQDAKQDQNKDSKNQDKESKDEKKDQNEQNQANPNELSKDEAERMLNELNHQEQNTRDQLQRKAAKGTKTQISKNW